MHGANRPFRQLLDPVEARNKSERSASIRPESGPNAGSTGTASPATNPYRMRNFIRPPRPEELFSLGGLVGKALEGVDQPLHLLMRKLSSRIGRERWSTPIRPDVGLADNPLIHSGYTYLLQLVAHDLVHSSLSLAGSAMGTMGLSNTRLFPLRLETIYGGGPDACPRAYEMDPAHIDEMGVIPRTKFRLGKAANIDEAKGQCPYQDIARAVPIDVRDRGIEPADQLKIGQASTPWRTEALIADPRNDDHALISQLTVLFQKLHNHIIDLIPADGAHAKFTPTELAYRRFLCAQFVVTLIYRNILVKDLLTLILHPEVYSLYTGPNPPMLDSQISSAKDTVPLEFTSAVFRFAHCMVRDEYKVNREEELPFDTALHLSSSRSPARLPVNAHWVVDWSRFFKITDREPNLSRRIGPVYPGVLTSSTNFKALSKLDQEGLPNRDLLTGCYAGLWSVPALTQVLRSCGLAKLLPEYAHWEPIVRAWVSKPASQYDAAPMTSSDIDTLSKDPPLLLFTMIEAGQPESQATPALNGSVGESLHLGVFGSIIVAETILGALRRTPISFEAAGPNLKDQIRLACATMLGEPNTLDAIPEITRMPELLEFMIAGGAISGPSS